MVPCVTQHKASRQLKSQPITFRPQAAEIQRKRPFLRARNAIMICGMYFVAKARYDPCYLRVLKRTIDRSKAFTEQRTMTFTTFLKTLLHSTEQFYLL